MNQIPTWRLYAPLSLLIVLFLVSTFIVSKFTDKNLSISVFFGMIVTCFVVIIACSAMLQIANLGGMPLPGREDVLVADEEPSGDR